MVRLILALITSKLLGYFDNLKSDIIHELGYHQLDCQEEFYKSLIFFN